MLPDPRAGHGPSEKAPSPDDPGDAGPGDSRRPGAPGPHPGETSGCDIRAELRESASRIRHQIDRCASITAKMLKFGRAGESSPRLVELSSGLAEIVALLDRQARVRNVALSVDADPALPRVTADPLELEQVVVNLVQNAFHALPGGGRVEIAALPGEGEVFLEVRDDGTGMAPEVADRIFEPFFTTKPVGEGTGLGLSICYGIVRGWGGALEVESEPGRGTVMRIRFPLAGRRDERLEDRMEPSHSGGKP